MFKSCHCGERFRPATPKVERCWRCRNSSSPEEVRANYEAIKRRDSRIIENTRARRNRGGRHYANKRQSLGSISDGHPDKTHDTPEAGL